MEKIIRYQPIPFEKRNKNKLAVEKYKKKVETSDAMPIDFFLLCKTNLQMINVSKNTTTGYITKIERTLTTVITFFVYFT